MNLQSGFVPGDSTVNQLVDIYNTFCHFFDQNKEVRAVCCNISKTLESGIEGFSKNLNLPGFLVLFCRGLSTI